MTHATPGIPMCLSSIRRIGACFFFIRDGKSFTAGYIISIRGNGPLSVACCDGTGGEGTMRDSGPQFSKRIVHIPNYTRIHNREGERPLPSCISRFQRKHERTC